MLTIHFYKLCFDNSFLNRKNLSIYYNPYCWVLKINSWKNSQRSVFSIGSYVFNFRNSARKISKAAQAKLCQEKMMLYWSLCGICLRTIFYVKLAESLKLDRLLCSLWSHCIIVHIWIMSSIVFLHIIHMWYSEVAHCALMGAHTHTCYRCVLFSIMFLAFNNTIVYSCVILLVFYMCINIWPILHIRVF